jgi:S-phase kinase-associated protein 1
MEGESFNVPISVANMSELVKTMIADDQDEDDVQEIPLPNVKSSILAKAIEFMQHYEMEPMREIEKVRFTTL